MGELKSINLNGNSMLKYALVKLKLKTQIYRSYIESQNDNNAKDGSMASSY